MSLFTDLYEWATASGRRTTPSAAIKASGFSNTPPTWGIVNDVIGVMADALTLLNVGLTDADFTCPIPPSAGGWYVDGTIGGLGFTGAKVHPSIAGNTIFIAYNVGSLVLQNETDPNAEWVLNSVVVTGVCSAAGTVDAYLYKKVTGASSWTLVGSTSFTASDTTKTIAASETMVEGTAYRAFIEVTTHGADLADSCYVTDVDVTFTRNGVP